MGGKYGWVRKTFTCLKRGAAKEIRGRKGGNPRLFMAQQTIERKGPKGRTLLQKKTLRETIEREGSRESGSHS